MSCGRIFGFATVLFFVLAIDTLGQAAGDLDDGFHGVESRLRALVDNLDYKHGLRFVGFREGGQLGT